MPNEKTNIFFDNLSTMWDENYAQFITYRDRNEVLKSWLQKKIEGKKGKFIEAIDIGCGTGQAISSYNHFEISPIGLDISQEMLEKAQKKGYKQSIHFDGIHLPLQNESVHLAHMFNVIEFVEHPEEMLSEIHRVLMVNGLFLMNIVNFRALLNRISRFINAALMRTPHEHPMLKVKYDYPKISELLRKVGFQNIRIFKYGLYERIKSIHASRLQELTRNRFLGQMIYIEATKRQ